jgi:glycosyltransferase involved in cell wall biosynthesis
VLFVVPYAPTRIRTRSYHLIRALAGCGIGLTVATVWADDDERATVDGLASVNGVGEVMAERVPKAASLLNCLRAAPGREPLQAHFSWSGRLAGRLMARVNAGGIDVVHVEHLRGVRYGLALADERRRRAARRPALVWDAVDCITSLFRRTAHQSQAWRARWAARLELPRTARYEAVAASRFDRVVVTSSDDCRELRALPGGDRLPANRVEVLSNGVDLTSAMSNEGSREANTVVVTGKMSYHANATAVLWLARAVMPHVWAVAPDVRLWIVGSRPPRELSALASPRVQVTGAVDDVRDYLSRASVAVAPIQYGVGVQNKVLEAMACGTPLVATPAAVGDLAVRQGHELVVADAAEDFARAIVSLLADPDRRAALARAGRTFVEAHHGWPAMAARLTRIYQEALASR